jgi:hypothetical protein
MSWWKLPESTEWRKSCAPIWRRRYEPEQEKRCAAHCVNDVVIALGLNDLAVPQDVGVGSEQAFQIKVVRGKIVFMPSDLTTGGIRVAVPAHSFQRGRN